jgi:hypothetical protein
VEHRQRKALNGEEIKAITHDGVATLLAGGACKNMDLVDYLTGEG